MLPAVRLLLLLYTLMIVSSSAPHPHQPQPPQQPQLQPQENSQQQQHLQQKAQKAQQQQQQQQEINDKHTVINLCGWPQSGTSLAHEIVERLEGTSTMIQKCTQINTERNCIGFNYESQWLLKGKDKNVLYSGSMCPLDSADVTTEGRTSMLARWSELWDTSNPYLISKSPANMMKIPYIHAIFDKAATTRHIVVIKHPVSLNIALPKKVTWERVLLMYNPLNPESPILRPDQSHIRYSGQTAKRMRLATVSNSLQSLLTLLHNDEDEMVENGTSTSSKCEVGNVGRGWIASMSHLANWLSLHKDFAHENVRILRFEDILDSPVRVCQYLTSFVYNGNKPDHLKIFDSHQGMRAGVASLKSRTGASGKVSQPSTKFNDPHGIMQQCELLFPNQGLKAESSSSRFSSKSKNKGRFRLGGRRKLQNNTRAADNDVYDSSDAFYHDSNNITTQGAFNKPVRSLRMHMNEDGSRATKWTFSPHGAQKSCAPRVRYFHKVFQLAKNKNHPLVPQLMNLDTTLRKFGYSMVSGSSYPYARLPSVLDEWDLMFGVKGRRGPE